MFSWKASLAISIFLVSGLMAWIGITTGFKEVEVKAQTESRVQKYDDRYITRYENEEVICYVQRFGSAGGMSCKWKSDRPEKWEL